MRLEQIEIYLSDTGFICLKHESFVDDDEIIAMSPEQVDIVAKEMIRLSRIAIKEKASKGD